ncbi:CPBP family intramembrane glutamic endopeptidase [Sphingomonas sp. CJ20]
MLVPALLLAAAVLGCVRLMRRDRVAFARFRVIEDSAARRRVLWRWLAQAMLLFLAMPLAGLALLGQIDAIATPPMAFAPLIARVPALPPLPPAILWSYAAALAVGGLVGGLIAARRRRKPAPVEALAPRNGREALAVAMLGSHAAVAEELFFRLYLPFLLTMIGLPPLAGFAGALLLFVAMHRYQGALGMAMTGLLGALFAFAYLASGGLALPIGLHLAINLNALLLRPAVAAWARRGGD